MHQMAQLVATVFKYEFPHTWVDAVEELNEVWKVGDTQAELVIAVYTSEHQSLVTSTYLAVYTRKTHALQSACTVRHLSTQHRSRVSFCRDTLRVCASSALGHERLLLVISSFHLFCWCSAGVLEEIKDTDYHSA